MPKPYQMSEENKKQMARLLAQRRIEIRQMGEAQKEIDNEAKKKKKLEQERQKKDKATQEFMERRNGKIKRNGNGKQHLIQQPQWTGGAPGAAQQSRQRMEKGGVHWGKYE